jgi:hypothetical protein
MNRSVKATVGLVGILAAVSAITLTGCGGATGPAPATVTVHDTSSSEAPSASASAKSWVMPDLRGGNLQTAQDAIQALTGNPAFFSTSTDLTGQGRMQVMDRNWQVCSSTPAPGESFTSTSKVDFGVVKIDSESCP